MSKNDKEEKTNIVLLKDFYNKGICPFEEIVSKDQEYRELGRKISDEEKYFESILSPSDLERLESCYELFIDRSVIDCRETFIYAFRLAVLLLIDALTESSK